MPPWRIDLPGFRLWPGQVQALSPLKFGPREAPHVAPGFSIFCAKYPVVPVVIALGSVRIVGIYKLGTLHEEFRRQHISVTP
jgi:hypothetical protein